MEPRINTLERNPFEADPVVAPQDRPDGQEMIDQIVAESNTTRNTRAERFVGAAIIVGLAGLAFVGSKIASAEAYDGESTLPGNPALEETNANATSYEIGSIYSGKISIKPNSIFATTSNEEEPEPPVCDADPETELPDCEPEPPVVKPLPFKQCVKAARKANVKLSVKTTKTVMASGVNMGFELKKQSVRLRKMPARCEGTRTTTTIVKQNKKRALLSPIKFKGNDEQKEVRKGKFIAAGRDMACGQGKKSKFKIVHKTVWRAANGRRAVKKDVYPKGKKNRGKLQFGC